MYALVRRPDLKIRNQRITDFNILEQNGRQKFHFIGALKKQKLCCVILQFLQFATWQPVLNIKLPVLNFWSHWHPVSHNFKSSSESESSELEKTWGLLSFCTMSTKSATMNCEPENNFQDKLLGPKEKFCG